MPRTIRFHLDEHVNPAVADGLRRRGIFTNDADFLRMHDLGVDHPGIVYCQQQSHSVGEIIRALERIWEVLESDEMADRVEFV